MPEAVLGEPSIDIAAVGTAKTLTLRFRFRPYAQGGTNTATPVIQKITIGKAAALKRRGKPDCLLIADEGVTMGEWHYGQDLSGFAKSGCNELGTGDYMVSVQFLGGYGGIRMMIDEEGRVKPFLPKGASPPLWDGK